MRNAAARHHEDDAIIELGLAAAKIHVEKGVDIDLSVSGIIGEYGRHG
jgi:hypothetical protein